jgi:phosphohistidine phosphatase
MRELLLLRHAKSDWSEGVEDFDRPLKQRGKKEALRMGEWLLEQNLCPDWIVSSPARRARETAEKLCKGLKLKKDDDIHFDDQIYEAGIFSLKHVLADCPVSSRRVLLVGHNPGLEDLLMDLAEGIEADEDGKLLATATLARLQMPNDWRDLNSYCGHLVSITRASRLDDDG